MHYFVKKSFSLGKNFLRDVKIAYLIPNDFDSLHPPIIV